MAVANPPTGNPVESWCKNRLQEFAQRASMPLPVYQTVSEGSPHAPQFRSQIWVDGTCYVSPTTFSNRKMAEQIAAKHALIEILEKVKNEGRSRIIEDTIFCKSIINEYVLKIYRSAPIYETNETKAMLPVFISSVLFNDLKFTGDAARNKKDAEQFAARSAILSILDSERDTTMSEIVRSKFKFYDALKKLKESPNVHGVTEPDGVASLENTGVQVEVVGTGSTGSFAATPQSTFGLVPSQVELLPPKSEQPSITGDTHQPIHEFKKPRLQTSSPEITPPIVFVPPASQQPPMSSTSGKKRKNKKAKKKMKTPSPSAVGVLPDNQVHAC